MVDKEWKNPDKKVVILSTRSQIDEKEKKDLLLNLKDITPEEIGNVWDEIYYSWMIRKLKEWCDDNNLDLDLALYLIDKWHIFLLMKNIEKFDKKNYKEIVFKIIEAISWNYSDEDANNSELEKEFTTFTNILWDIFYSKDVAILLIEIDAESFLINIDKFRELDSEVLKNLVWKWCDLHELKNLQCFAEKDRKDAALEIIKSWWNPDLSAITTLTLRPDHQVVELNFAWTLTLDFALEILNIGTEHAYKYLSDNMKYFDPSTRKSIAMRYIEDGYEDQIKINWFYDHMVFDKEIFLKLIDKKCSKDWFSKDITEHLLHYYWPDKEIMDTLVEKWYDLKTYSSVLFHIPDDIKCYVAVLILKAWWEPDLSLIPKE